MAESLNGGYIKLYRRLQENGYYRDSHYVHLWVHLLFKANHKPQKILWNKKEMTIGRGQFITGRKQLSDETGINQYKIDRVLKFFENAHQITQQMFPKFRLVSIENYDHYQSSAQQTAQHVHSKCTASAHKQ